MNTNDTPEKQKASRFGVAAFVVSLITVLTATRTMIYINYAPDSPIDMLIYKISSNVSIYSPFISIALAFIGLKEKDRSQILGYVAMGISLFTLSTVGFAYMLSAIYLK